MRPSQLFLPKYNKTLKMLMLKVLLVLGVLMVVCLVVCQPMLSTTIIVNPTPSPVPPTPVPTPTPTSILIMKDTFAQTGVLTVAISNSAHIPEFGRWVNVLDINSPTVTPGDGYCTSNSGALSTKIENISSYNPLTDTLLCDVHTTFPSTLTTDSYVYMFIGVLEVVSPASPFNSIFMDINYAYTAGTITITIYQVFSGVLTPLGNYQLPVLELDTELLFSLRMDPTGTVIVYRNDVPVLQCLVLGVSRILPLIDTIQMTVFTESRLNYFAVTALRP